MSAGLHVRGLHTYFAQSHILQGVSMEVEPGTLVSLLGRNGAGKTTTLKSIMGVAAPRSGRILFNGVELTALAPYRIARQGISYVPENRGIFPSLSVLENLTLAQSRRNAGAWSLERVFEVFPRLHERRDIGGAQLSGGEQQMLSIARALLLNPRLLILDEPTEGLAPLPVEEIRSVLEKLKRDGVTMLLVEQNYPFATSLANRLYVLGKGRIRWQGTVRQFASAAEVKHTWLGV